MDSKKLDKLIVKLARQGTGAKKRLASEIGCSSPQLSLFLKTGYIAGNFEDKIIKWMEAKYEN